MDDRKRLKTVILLSGGLDSAVNLKRASVETDVLLALTFDYGQEAAPREIEASARMCVALGVPHRVVGLDWLAEITQTALVSGEKEIPAPSPEDLDSPEACARSASAVWVPNRNGVFIAVGAAFAESMGAHEVIFLDYCDSGMAGSQVNQDPKAYINAPDEEVVARLVDIIRDLQPQLVLTFEPNGVYGHPDHIAVSRQTTSAFHLAADPGYAPGIGDPWQAERLFYSGIPHSWVLQMIKEMQNLGEDASYWIEFDRKGLTWPEGNANLVIDVSDTILEKWDALECHRTQFGPDNLFQRIPRADALNMMSREFFALAWPEPAPGLVLTSLFDGLPEWRVFFEKQDL